MKFRQITILEPIPVADRLIEKLSKYSDGAIRYFDTPATNDDEKIERIGDSDCLLVSFNHKVSSRVIEGTNFKYIGLCSTLYKGENCNVDWDSVQKKGITITGISDYGTIGTVEFSVAEIIMYFKNGSNRELRGKDIGIIGMGDVGSKLAKALLNFGANVFYYNRSRKTEMEKSGVRYLELHELLGKVDVLSLNLPRNTKVLGKKELDTMKVKMLINTGLGNPFDVDAFHEWVDRGGKGVFDKVSLGDVDPEKVRYFDEISGYTDEARVRVVQKVEENIVEFLGLNSD